MQTRTTPAWKIVTRAGVPFGAALVLAALVLRDIRPQAFVQTHTISLVMLICGAVITLGCLVSNYDLILDFVRRPRTALGANAAAQVLLAVALAALVCYIGSVRFARFDMTGTRRYTLHSKTVRMLRSLKQPVDVTVVYSEPAPEALMIDPQAQLIVWGYQQATDMLDTFQALSPQITVRELDRRTDQRALRELSARVELPGSCVVFESGEKHDVIPLLEIVQAPQWQGGSPRFTGEAAFASALAKIVEGEMQTVYFLTGHGERPLEGLPVTREMSRTADILSSEAYSLSRLAAKLKADNFESRPLDLSETGAVPDDCAVLVIAGPRIPLPREHLDAIRLYAQSPEGRVIAMVDSSLLNPEAATNVGELLADFGVTVHADAMAMRLAPALDFSVGRVVAVAEDQIVIGRSGCAEHPITSDLLNYQIALVGCAPLELAATSAEGVSAKALLTAEETSWGERARWRSRNDRMSAKYDAGHDLAGPVVVAAVVEPSPPPAMPYASAPENPRGPKMLVVGSSLSFVNESVAQNPPNLYLLLNAVNWLAGKGHMVGIPPRDIDINLVSLSAARIRLGRWLFALVVPLLVVAGGVVIWQARRR